MKNTEGRDGIAVMDINEGVALCEATPQAVLLDVRTALEYRMGHIPNSRNVPLQKLSRLEEQVSTPLFVYCLAGTRSRQAVLMLQGMGYEQVTDLGGISAYSGPLTGRG